MSRLSAVPFRILSFQIKTQNLCWDISYILEILKAWPYLVFTPVLYLHVLHQFRLPDYIAVSLRITNFLIALFLIGPPSLNI